MGENEVLYITLFLRAVSCNCFIGYNFEMKAGEDGALCLVVTAILG